MNINVNENAWVKLNVTNLQLVRWDMSYDLELFPTEASSAQIKVIAHVPPT
jgi:hypothetical protein